MLVLRFLIGFLTVGNAIIATTFPTNPALSRILGRLPRYDRMVVCFDGVLYYSECQTVVLHDRTN